MFTTAHDSQYSVRYAVRFGTEILVLTAGLERGVVGKKSFLSDIPSRLRCLIRFGHLCSFLSTRMNGN